MDFRRRDGVRERAFCKQEVTGSITVGSIFLFGKCARKVVGRVIGWALGGAARAQFRGVAAGCADPEQGQPV
jgi:hypothetical protein